jgi:hypothetical protein
MTPTEYGRTIAALVNDWPAGAMVWHRANGKRGLVIGWEIRHAGNTFVIVDYAAGPMAEYPMCLSREPVAEGGDGEHWKTGAGS